MSRSSTPTGPRIDLTGRVFGRLTALSFSHAEKKQGPNYSKTRHFWNCKCDCGRQKLIDGSSLKSGNTRSCGCLHRDSMVRVFTTHGMGGKNSPGKRVYYIWAGMLDRCRNPKATHYHRYGGRGITVCERWHDFANFFADMGDPPPGHSIERVDNDSGYCLENCKWIPLTHQAHNTSRSVRLTFNGKTQCISKWARELNLDPKRIAERLRNGKTVEQALTMPVRPDEWCKAVRILITFNGQTKSVQAWGEELGTTRNVIRNRLERGWSVERTLTTPVIKRKRKT